MIFDLIADEKNTWDEFKIKREAVFEFEQKPKVSRDGDNVTIEFITKGFCDVTIAIENEEGKIVRHLASGVLGPNVPLPFQKDSKQQKVIWDGKDLTGKKVDAGQYICMLSAGANVIAKLINFSN